jgi:hypothetical protein
MSTSDIDDKIAKLESEKRELLRKRAKLQQLTTVEQLAILMHETMCRWNHTDGCSWHYFMKDGLPTWEADSQRLYLDKARALYDILIRLVDEADVLPQAKKILETVR